MFVRVIRKENNDIREILINVNTVWKIEVTYHEVGKDGDLYRVRSPEMMDEPSSVRLYKIFFGGDSVELSSTDDAKAVKVFADIYDNSIR